MISGESSILNLFDIGTVSSDSLPPVPEHYDYQNLDYKYLEKATNVKELKELLAVLKSGSQGYYPELEAAFLNKIIELEPSFSVNVKEAPARKTKESVDDFEAMIRDLKVKDVDINQSKLKPQPKKNAVVEAKRNHQTKKIIETLPDTNPNKSEKKTTPNKIRGADYRAWDRFDVDNALEMIDKEEVSTAPSNSNVNNVSIESKVHVDTSLKTPQELKYISEYERLKGNECYKVGEYVEAIEFYTKSIMMLPCASAYTNRSIAYMKINNYERAEDDATEAININSEQFNFKAYLRRGQARFKRGWNLHAIQDYDEALRIKPENLEALKARKEAEIKLKEVGGLDVMPSTAIPNRMQIQINDESDKEDDTQSQILEDRYVPTGFKAFQNSWNGPKIEEIFDHEESPVNSSQTPKEIFDDKESPVSSGRKIKEIVDDESPVNTNNKYPNSIIEIPQQTEEKKSRPKAIQKKCGNDSDDDDDLEVEIHKVDAAEIADSGDESDEEFLSKYDN